jgi:hypothetical protein
MKFRWALAAALVLVSACGSSNSSNKVDTTSPGTTSFVLPSEPFPVTKVDNNVVHKERFDPLDQETAEVVRSIPDNPHPHDTTGCEDVSDSTINKIVGWEEVSIWFDCSHGWLEAMSENCGECEGVSIYRRINGTWEHVTTCHNYNLSAFSCGESGPPQEIMCVLWSNDRILGALTRTGCSASREDIRSVTNTPCEYWSEWDRSAALPWGNCVYGWEVRSFQQRLFELGYNTNTDGYFGVMSARAVLRYQNDHNMKLTASLDDRTYGTVTGN